MSVIEIRIPSDVEILEAAERAADSNLHLITDGRETRLSPIVPPGWYRLAGRVKDAA